MDKPRVLLVAPFDGHTATYVMEALAANGCEAIRFPYRELAAILGVPAMNDHLIERGTSMNLVLILKGELVEVRAIEALRYAGTRVAVWNFDPREGRSDWVLQRAAACDHYFTIAKGLVHQYQSEGINAHWLSEGAHPFYHQPITPDPARQIPISFIGTVTDVPGREEWLLKIVQKFGSRKVAIYGSFCPPSLKNVYRGRANGDYEFCSVVSSSLVNLGRDRNPEIERSYGARLFRTLAVGGMLVTNNTLGIKEDFKDCLAVYDEDSDCVDLIEAVLDWPEGRERVALRGRETVLASHTFTHRLKYLLETVGVS